jgi:hypothetical protein
LVSHGGCEGSDIGYCSGHDGNTKGHFPREARALVPHPGGVGGLADEVTIRATANDQREKHLHLHNGLSLDAGDLQDVQDEWCYQCPAEFLGATLSNSFAQGLLEESDRKGGTLKYVTCEKVIALAMKALRFFGELS